MCLFIDCVCIYFFHSLWLWAGRTAGSYFEMFCSVSIVVCVIVVPVCVAAFSAFGISRSVVCGFEKSLFCACSRCGLGLRNAMFIDCYVLFGGYDHYFLSSKYILNSIAFYRASKHHLEHYICSPWNHFGLIMESACRLKVTLKWQLVQQITIIYCY